MTRKEMKLTITPAQIRRAENISYKSVELEHCEFKCSICNVEIGVVEGGVLDGGRFNYCPNCGAKMDNDYCSYGKRKE